MIATPTNFQSGNDGITNKFCNTSTKEERRPSRAELVAPKSAKKINVNAFLEAHRSRRAAMKEKSRDPEITGDSSPSNETVNLLTLATAKMGEKAKKNPIVADNPRTQSARTPSSEPKPQPPTPSTSHLRMQPASLLQFKLLWWMMARYARNLETLRKRACLFRWRQHSSKIRTPKIIFSVIRKQFMRKIRQRFIQWQRATTIVMAEQIASSMISSHEKELKKLISTKRFYPRALHS